MPDRTRYHFRLLRAHPAMTYRGMSNWPPKWVRRGGAGENKEPRGEIGVLRDIFLSKVDPRARIYLIIQHENEEYIGCLLFLDATFRGRIFELLIGQLGRPIAAIGELDVSDLQ